MNNINHSNLNSAIKKLEALIQKMQRSIENASPVRDTTRFTENGLNISFEDERERRNIQVELYEAVNHKTGEVWSRNAINRLLDDAIYQSINFGKQSSKPFPNRFAEAVKKLKTELLSPLKEWEFYFPVLGLTADNKQRAIGSITLIQGSPKNIKLILERLAKITDGTLNSAEEKKEFKKFQASRLKELVNVAISTVDVNAGDVEAARIIALEKVQTALDILNCYIPFLYGKDSRIQVYLPGDTSSDTSINIAFQKDIRSNLQLDRRGPFINFKLTDLTKQKTKKYGINRLDEILCKSKLTEMEERLFYATRFAGRAAVSRRREDSFLFYAIALESLLIGGNEQKDLTLLLSLRTALILGKNLAEREKIKSEVGKLYGIRSAIVHRGSTKVDDNDLDLIQYYTLNIIISLLTGRVFRKFVNKSELNNWFEKKLLTF